MIMILDVGCGLHVVSNALHVDIDKKACHLEVLCDIQYLPFQDESFDVVYASHVLEHMKNPAQTVLELRRITRIYVVLKVPNPGHHILGETDEHLYGWNAYNFQNFLKQFFREVKVRPGYRIIHDRQMNWIRRKYWTLQLYLISLFFGPNEIVAVCKK